MGWALGRTCRKKKALKPTGLADCGWMGGHEGYFGLRGIFVRYDLRWFFGVLGFNFRVTGRVSSLNCFVGAVRVDQVEIVFT